MLVECPQCEKPIRGRKCPRCGWRPVASEQTTAEPAPDDRCTWVTSGRTCQRRGIVADRSGAPLYCAWHFTVRVSTRLSGDFAKFEEYCAYLYVHAYCLPETHYPAPALWARMSGRAEAELPPPHPCADPSCAHALGSGIGSTSDADVRRLLHETSRRMGGEVEVIRL